MGGVDSSKHKRMKHKGYALSDIGRARTHNEDAYLLDSQLGLYVLCDGLGGHSAGEVASRRTCRLIRDYVAQQRQQLDEDVNVDRDMRLWAKGVVQDAVQYANRRIRRQAEADSEKQGMGCTLALVWMVDHHAVVAHVGDSRVYMLRDRKLHQLTVDHNVFERELRRGRLDMDQLKQGLDCAGVSRVIGIDDQVQAETLFLSVTRSDRFLLCSDGLTGHVSSDELRRAMKRNTIKALPKVLIGLANERGGQDNITVATVQVTDTDPDHDMEVERRMKVMFQIKLFKKLPFVELIRIIGAASSATYEKGQTIIAENDRNAQLYICMEGNVEVRKQGWVIDQLGSGDLFGTMSLIDKNPSSVDIVAVEPTQVLVWPRQHFFTLIERDRYIASRILWRLCRTLNNRVRYLINELAATKGPAPQQGEGDARFLTQARALEELLDEEQ